MNQEKYRPWKAFVLPFILLLIGIIFFSFKTYISKDLKNGIPTFTMLLSFVLGILIAIINILKIYNSELNRTSRYIHRQFVAFQNKLSEFDDTIVNKMATAVKRGGFYKLNSESAIKYITKNLDNYTELYNIRYTTQAHPIGLTEAINHWRKIIKQSLDNNREFKMWDIFVGHKGMDSEVLEMVEFYNTCCEEYKNSYNIEYNAYFIEPSCFSLQIRSFMILKNKLGYYELYWGWHDENASDKKNKANYLTYFTTDQDMVKDYTERYYDIINNNACEKI